MRRDSGPSYDLVGLVFRLLNLSDELCISEDARDSLGNIRPGTIFPRGDLRYRAVVDEAAGTFLDMLLGRGILKESDLISRWPNNKRYVVLLTHDTDALLVTPVELAKTAVKAVLTRNSGEAAAFADGVRRLVTRERDPYFSFQDWAEFEAELGAKSAFFVYMRRREVPGHFNNPKYRVSSKQLKWNLLRSLAERGWEIGLHASINSLAAGAYIHSERVGLESVLGTRVVGNRSHYWSLNWRNPTESFLRLVAAGFQYDSSMAWKDSPGFRAGTTLPYHPFDCDRREAVPLLELPVSVMDGHLFRSLKPSDPNRLFTQVVSEVRNHRGVLNLNWHTQTWVDRFAFMGWRTFLVAEVARLASQGDAWFTTPAELAAHWSKRERSICDALVRNAVT